jgi:cytoskeletal protein CcmA (bactofilin family)
LTFVPRSSTMVIVSNAKDAIQDSAAPAARTIVDEGTKFKGALSSTSPILVQGTVEGDVSGPAVSVSASGLAGSFDVDTAQIAGKVAKDTVVRASSVHLKLNAVDGRLEVRFERGNASK